MELYFLNDSFTLIDGPVDEFTSVIWRERYYECGSFEICFPRRIISRLDGVSYIRSGEGDGYKCGKIEYIKTDTDEGVKVGGHLLESLLDARVISGRGYYSGSVSSAVTSVVSSNLRQCGVVMSDNSVQISGVGVFGYAWSMLSGWVRRVLKPYGASYKIVLDMDTLTPTFSIIRGRDLSTGSTTLQSGENPVVFSSSFENIHSIGMTKRIGTSKNVVYVEGGDGTVITVDHSSGGVTRELYVKADDILPEDFDDTTSYTSALNVRGSEEIAKYKNTLSVTAESDTSSLPVYGVDYVLGDICDVCDTECGISQSARLTEVETVWQDGERFVYPVFGER